MSALLAIGLMMMAAERPGGPPESLSPQESSRLEQRYFTNPRPLTTEGVNGEAYFSPDGSKIIFQSIRGDHPFYQIYIKDISSGQDRLVSTGEGRTTCAYFHPTKPKIIFASSHLDPKRAALADAERDRLAELRRNPPKSRSYQWSFDPHLDIFEADLDGKNLRRLTDAPGYDAEGSYSPDGKSIVFCSFREGSGNIYVMNADGSEPRRLTFSPGYDGGPFFSHDGKRIIFRGEARKKELLQIFVINADGTGERQLTRDDNVNWGPYWHPDGRRVIYSTSRHGHYNYELYLLDVDTGKTERVTYTPGADVLPVFSADGKKLLWTSKRPIPGGSASRDASSQLWIADWIDHGAK